MARWPKMAKMPNRKTYPKIRPQIQKKNFLNQANLYIYVYVYICVFVCVFFVFCFCVLCFYVIEFVNLHLSCCVIFFFVYLCICICVFARACVQSAAEPPQAEPLASAQREFGWKVDENWSNQIESGGIEKIWRCSKVSLLLMLKNVKWRWRRSDSVYPCHQCHQGCHQCHRPHT